MHNEYLHRLGLQPGATKSEVKTAYRKLSKQYHPDLNKAEGAVDKFIEINEAYEFLTSVGPTPHREPVSYDYDPFEDEYEKWRRAAQRKAKRRADEDYRNHVRLVNSLLSKLNWVVGAVLIFNLCLIIDFYLPRENNQQDILKVKKVLEGFEHSSRVEHRYDEIQFTDYTMRFSKGDAIGIEEYDNAIVIATKLFDKPQMALITVEGNTIRLSQLYNIYNFFGYLIPAVFITYLVSLAFTNPDNRLTMIILLMVIAIAQIVFFVLY